MRRPAAALLLAASVLPAGCAATSPQTRGSTAPSPGTTGATTSASVGGLPFTVTPVGEAFREPWAMTFLPDGSALVTERPGTLLRVDVRTGARARVTGTPQVAYGGQGGLGDVVLGPRFAQDRVLYLSWAEAGEKGTSGAAVGRARLSDDGARLEGLHVIWRQSPKVTGQGHYGHRIAVSPDGTHLFITSGERQKFDPAQDDAVNLGARLESLNKEYGTAILISEDTRRRLTTTVTTRLIGPVTVKGRTQPVTVYEVVAPPRDPGNAGTLKSREVCS